MLRGYTPKDAIGITDTIGRQQRQTIINESGLYSLILRSSKPEAKRFKKWVTKEVLPSIRKTGGYGRNTPAFIRRYNQNWDRCALGHFSVINELVVRLWGRFEHLGHVMADVAANGRELRPDVSVGMGFSKWLTANYPTIADNCRVIGRGRSLRIGDIFPGMPGERSAQLGRRTMAYWR